MERRCPGCSGTLAEGGQGGPGWPGLAKSRLKKQNHVAVLRQGVTIGQMLGAEAYESLEFHLGYGDLQEGLQVVNGPRKEQGWQGEHEAHGCFHGIYEIIAMCHLTQWLVCNVCLPLPPLAGSSNRGKRTFQSCVRGITHGGMAINAKDQAEIKAAEEAEFYFAGNTAV